MIPCSCQILLSPPTPRHTGHVSTCGDLRPEGPATDGPAPRSVPCLAVPHGTRFAGRAGRPSTRPCSSCRLPLRCGCLPACIAVTTTAARTRLREGEASSVRAGVRVRPLWIRCERIPTLGFWLISTITILIRIGSLSSYRPYIEAQWVYRVRRSICNRWQICGRREQGLIGKLSRINKWRIGFFFHCHLYTHERCTRVCVFFWVRARRELCWRDSDGELMLKNQDGVRFGGARGDVRDGLTPCHELLMSPVTASSTPSFMSWGSLQTTKQATKKTKAYQILSPISFPNPGQKKKRRLYSLVPDSSFACLTQHVFARRKQQKAIEAGEHKEGEEEMRSSRASGHNKKAFDWTRPRLAL